MNNVEYFCPLPWIHQSIRPSGNTRVCCHAQAGPTHGMLKDSNNEVIKYDQINDGYNAPLLKDIRKSILNNEFHPECTRCEKEFNSGMVSRFMFETSNWEKLFNKQDAMMMTNDDGSLNKKPNIMYMDIRFGNLCNLKCRTCGPTDSSMWYDDYAELYGDSFEDQHGIVKLVKIANKYVPENDVYGWHSDEQFWINLEINLPHIRHVYFAGGEPLLIDRHYEFLQRCVDIGASKNITIEYNTNLTNIPQRAYDIWKEFKQINIGISIDGVGIVNDYIRFPSKWKSIEQNILKIDNADGNYALWFAVTVHNYNVLHFPDILIWKYKQNFKRINIGSKNPLVTPHPVHQPKFLNIQSLPLEIKNKIKNHYDNKKIEFKDICNEPHILIEFEKILDNYINFMFQNDQSEQFQHFVDKTNKLDMMRNQNLKDSIPDLYKLLKDYI